MRSRCGSLVVGLFLQALSCLCSALADKRPCRKDCTCDVVFETPTPMPFGLMDCSVTLQGFRARVLIPDDKPNYENLIVVHSPDDFYHSVGQHHEMTIDALLPFVSLLGVHLQPGSLMVDAGAGMGLQMIVISMMFPETNVIGLEPNPWYAALANENLRRNGVSKDRAWVINAGLTGDGRNITLRQATPTWELDTYLDYWNLTVPSLTFDQVLQQIPDSPLAFLRVSCNGCEFEFLDLAERLAIPYVMKCDLKGDAGSEQIKRCLATADAGVERFFQHGAFLKGCPVTYAFAQISDKFGSAWTAKSPTPTLRSGESILQELPEGLARWQYAALLSIAPRLRDFHLASALDTDDVAADLNVSASLFIGVAEAPAAAVLAEGAPGDGRRLLPLYRPVLESMQTAAMFRAGKLLRRMGYDGEAMEWFSRAAARGHSLAYVEMALSQDELRRKINFPYVAAKDGKMPPFARQRALTRIQMESLGFPPALQLLFLNGQMGSQFDDCIRQHQERRIPTWAAEFPPHGHVFEPMAGYRFRSWLQSAMDCWLADSQRLIKALPAYPDQLQR